jgi:receptor protein-tyrosine kinase
MQQVMPKPADKDAQDEAIPAAETNGEVAAAPVLTRAMPLSLSPAPTPKATRSTLPDVRLNFAKLRDLRIVTPDNKSSTTYNQFRAIKRKLLPMARDPHTNALSRNVMLVTSALPGEGKTFTSMNLAIGFAAERNLDVILIDGDVVRATVGQYFEGSRDVGLLDVLTGRREHVDEVMHRCADMPNLHVIFAGKHEEASPELLASKRMAECVATLSKLYPECIVLIDAPPVLATSEPVALAMHADHLIMVVAAGMATRAQIEEALTIVSACPNINLLFNKAPEWQGASGYPYYYNYAKP